MAKNYEVSPRRTKYIMVAGKDGKKSVLFNIDAFDFEISERLFSGDKAKLKKEIEKICAPGFVDINDFVEEFETKEKYDIFEDFENREIGVQVVNMKNENEASFSWSVYSERAATVKAFLDENENVKLEWLGISKELEQTM